MSCTYNYKGNEFTSREELEAFVAKENVTSNSSPNKMIFELSGLAAIPEARHKALDKYNTTEFLSFIENAGKNYMVVDERLFNEQSGNTRIIVDANGATQEVDIDEMVSKYTKGQLNPSPSLYDAIQARLAQTIKEQSRKDLFEGKQTPNQDVTALLNSFASKMGITITTMDEYRRNYEERNGIPPTVEALADTFNKVIALSNTDNTENLSEEVAHFAIEYYNNQDVLNQMLVKVDQTNTYKNFQAQYREVYSKDYSGTALENKVRKEVLGKLLSESIQNQFNTENKGLNETGIISLLQELWNQFLDLFRITDSNRAYFREFGKVLDNIAKETTGDVFSNFTPTESKEVYYSLTKEEKAVSDSLSGIASELTNRYRNIHKDSRLDKKIRSIQLETIGDNIRDAAYLQAIQGYIALLRLDMGDAFSAIETAINARTAAIEKQRVLLGSSFVMPTEAEQEDMLVDLLGDVNIPNLTIYNQNIDKLIGEISSNLDYLSKTLPNNSPSRNKVSAVKKSLESLINLKNKVQPDIIRVHRNITASRIEEAYIKNGASKQLAKEYADRFRLNTMKDVNWATSFFMGYGSYGNEVTDIIYADVRYAEAVAAIQTRSFMERLNRKTKEFKLSSTDVNKLFHKGFMLEEIDRREAEIAYDKAKEVLIEKRAKELSELPENTINYEELKDNIEENYVEALNNLRKEWEVQKYTKDFEDRLTKRTNGVNPITGSRLRSKEAQGLIRELGNDKRIILAKYKGRDGSINQFNISPADRGRLQGINSDIKRFMSFYEENGDKKEGKNLAIAIDIVDYYSSFGEFNISEKAKAKFEAEMAQAKAKLSPQEYKKWLEYYTYQKYSEQDLPMGTLARTIDVDATEAEFQKNKKILQTIKNSVVILDLKGKEPTYQQLYDALKDKQEQILKPYRKIGNSSEIDGSAVESNNAVLQALDEVQTFMSYFRFDSKSDKNFVQSANESFINKYNKLKSTPRELNEWLKLNAQVDTISGGYKMQYGYPVPQTRYYSKFELTDVNGNLVQKEVVPTVYWEMLVSDKAELNPAYNQQLEGKAIQFSQKIKDQYKNQNYFDTFKPNSEGYATVNKDLFAFRSYLLLEKSTMDGIAQIKNNYFMLPQVRPYGAEAISSIGKLKSKLADTVVSNRYDEDFNVDSPSYNTRKENAFLPKHFHIRADDPQYLSSDLSHIMFNYAQMAHNYQEKSKILIKMEVMKNALAESYFKDKGKGENTRVLKTTEEFLSSNLYGNRFIEIGSKDIKGSRISATKTVNTMYSWRSITNLGLSPFTPVVGGISANIQRRILKSEGAYFTEQSVARADKMTKYSAGMLTTLQDLGKAAPTTYLGKLDLFSGVRNVEQELAKGLFSSNKLTRLAKQTDPFFAGYAAVGKLVAINTTLAVYDNFRLVDGEFITFRTYEEQQVAKDGTLSRKQILDSWKAYQSNSFLDFLVEEPHNIRLDIEKLRDTGYMGDATALKARIDIAARTANELVEGQATGADSALSTRNPLIKLAFWIHKGFFQRFIERSFKRRQINTIIGAEEEGTYLTFGRVMKNGWTNLSMRENFQLWAGYFYAFKQHDAIMTKLGLDSVDKINTRRIRTDLRMYAGAMAFYVMLNLLADDEDREDDYLTQYAAYISSRVFNETSSVQLPFAANDAVKLLQSPSSGLSFLEGFIGIPGLLVEGTDEITRGKYEGFNKFEKALIQSLPIKNVIEPMLSNPRKSNLFFRMNTIPTSVEHFYGKLSDNVYN